MEISKRKSIMKNISLSLLLSLLLLTLTACGGGGGGGVGGTPAIDSQAKTTATLKINLTGMLPNSTTTISGAAFILTLPANVTPAMTNGSVKTGVVSCSGTFAGSTLAPQVVYTAATSSTPGSLNVILASSVPTGIAAVGEAATINLQLANGAAPTSGSFGLSAVGVFDAAVYEAISGMSVSVAGVSLR